MLNPGKSVEITATLMQALEPETKEDLTRDPGAGSTWCHEHGWDEEGQATGICNGSEKNVYAALVGLNILEVPERYPFFRHEARS